MLGRSGKITEYFSEFLFIRGGKKHIANTTLEPIFIYIENRANDFDMTVRERIDTTFDHGICGLGYAKMFSEICLVDFQYFP